MLEDKSKDTERMKKRWDERAKRYDEYYQTFEGAVEHYVDWELLKRHLPQSCRSSMSALRHAQGGEQSRTTGLLDERMCQPTHLSRMTFGMVDLQSFGVQKHKN
jgi:hypothetical protein